MKQSVVFGFFKGDKLLGFRQDTMGSIGSSPKIYEYSEDQVRIVLENVFGNIVEVTKPINDQLADLAREAECGNQMAVAVAGIHRRSSNQFANLGEFEVRVLPCPSKKNDEYPHFEMVEFIRGEMPEAIETHKFKS